MLDLTATMAAYNAEYLAMLHRKFGGESTVNELRVMNCVFCAEVAGQDVGVSQVSRALGIPKSTVSRAALKLRQAGWIREVASPNDGRRRLLRLTPALWERYLSEHDKLVELWPSAA